MKPRQKEIVICYLIAIDGRYCNGCNTPFEELEHKVEIDHIDDDSMNDDLSNLQLLCKKCNISKENHSRQVN